MLGPFPCPVIIQVGSLSVGFKATWIKAEEVWSHCYAHSVPCVYIAPAPSPVWSLRPGVRCSVPHVSCDDRLGDFGFDACLGADDMRMLSVKSPTAIHWWIFMGGYRVAVRQPLREPPTSAFDTRAHVRGIRHGVVFRLRRLSLFQGILLCTVLLTVRGS